MKEERRRRPRFKIRQPISLELPHNGIRTLLHGTTENVSMIGVLVTAAAEISENAAVDLTLTIAQPRTPPHPLRLPNSGKVVRVERRPDGYVSIAIECDRAFELVEMVHPR